MVRYLLCRVQNTLYKGPFRNTNFNFETELRPAWDRNFSSYPRTHYYFLFPLAGSSCDFCHPCRCEFSFLFPFRLFLEFPPNPWKFRCGKYAMHFRIEVLVFFFRSADYRRSYCYFFFRVYKSRVLSWLFMAPFENVKKKISLKKVVKREFYNSF